MRRFEWTNLAVASLVYLISLLDIVPSLGRHRTGNRASLCLDHVGAQVPSQQRGGFSRNDYGNGNHLDLLVRLSISSCYPVPADYTSLEPILVEGQRPIANLSCHPRNVSPPNKVCSRSRGILQ